MADSGIIGLILQTLAIFGGISVIAGGVASFVAKFFVDRTNEKYRAEISHEIERLKGELSKEGESHKLRLRKQEILFQKELMQQRSSLLCVVELSRNSVILTWSGMKQWRTSLETSLILRADYKNLWLVTAPSLVS